MRLRSAATAAVVTVAGAALHPVLQARRPGWMRTNYRGRRVSLVGGAAVALGSAAGAWTAGGRAGRGAALTVAAAAAAGAYDDLIATRVESVGDKGLRGHLAAVRAGRVSGGAVKTAVIGATATAVAARTTAGSGAGRAVRVLLRAVVIAGSANLVNLLDLRPGRAGKLALAAGVVLLPGASGGLGAAAAGAAAAELPGDLAERLMLGDCGANAIGALLGVRLALGRDRSVVPAAVVLTALTAASERWSFSAVIDACPPLRALDRLGRRP